MVTVTTFTAIITPLTTATTSAFRAIHASSTVQSTNTTPITNTFDTGFTTPTKCTIAASLAIGATDKSYIL